MLQSTVHKNVSVYILSTILVNVSKTGNDLLHEGNFLMAKGKREYFRDSTNSPTFAVTYSCNRGKLFTNTYNQ